MPALWTRELLSKMVRRFGRFVKPAAPVAQQDTGVPLPFVAEPWFVNRVELTPAGLTVTGWALPPTQPGVPVVFTVNGQPFDRVNAQQPLPGLEERFWQRPNAGHAKYECQSRRSADELLRDGYLCLEYDYPGRPKRFPFHGAWFVPDPRKEALLPEENRRYRVIASAKPEHFRLGGFTDFMRMNRLLQALFGHGYEGFPRVLDWGCGCGRVACHFSGVPGVQFTGGDIDPDNINWCAQHLPFGRFQVLPLRPPTALPAGSFDLIYGISVFTHLREDVQRLWLAELHRLAAPGAVLLLTIHGATALNYANLPRAPYYRLADRLRREGFFITADNGQINTVIADKDYYVDVFHSTDYIQAQWGQYFEVLDIIPGYIFTHDLVVLRKAG